MTPSTSLITVVKLNDTVVKLNDTVLNLIDTNQKMLHKLYDEILDDGYSSLTFSVTECRILMKYIASYFSLPHSTPVVHS